MELYRWVKASEENFPIKFGEYVCEDKNGNVSKWKLTKEADQKLQKEIWFQFVKRWLEPIPESEQDELFDKKTVFNHRIVWSISGIQVNSDCNYLLKCVDISEINTSGYTNEVLDIFRNNTKVSDMINRIKMGGLLPAIILYEDMNIADGQHRMAAYLLAGVKKINVLIKIKNNE